MGVKHQMPLQIAVDPRGRAAVVRLSGAADIDQTEMLQERLAEIDRQAADVLVLDLSALTFICSTGLGAIVRSHAAAHAHSGRVRLVAPAGPVRNVLDATRLSALIPVFGTVDEALGAD